MKKMIEKGRLLLVTIDQSRLKQRIEEHGRLWIVESAEPSNEPDNTRYWCRSLATNKRYVWLEGEVREEPPCPDPDS